MLFLCLLSFLFFLSFLTYSQSFQRSVPFIPRKGGADQRIGRTCKVSEKKNLSGISDFMPEGFFCFVLKRAFSYRPQTQEFDLLRCRSGIPRCDIGCHRQTFLSQQPFLQAQVGIFLSNRPFQEDAFLWVL